MHAHYVADELGEREQALRKLPLPYSLALRLRDAGVAADLIGEYVGVQEASLDGVFRLAEAKLDALRETRGGDGFTVNGNTAHTINGPATRRRRSR